MRARNKIIIIIIIVVGYSFLPLDQSKPMSVSTEHCFSSNDTWGPIDRCIAETRLNEVLSANSLYWAIGGIIFVLVTVWLMLDRFSSKLKGKNLNNNTEEVSENNIVELDHIYCWKCGKSITVNSKFCLDCGSDMKKPEIKSDNIVEDTPEKTIEEA